MENSCRLIQTFTKDDIKLTGLYSPGDKAKTAFIFIHGFGTDFYSHAFYHSFSEKLAAQGNSILLAQNRGTGLYTEFIKKGGTGLNLGSYYERIEESHLDISAFVEILIKEGYQKIGLIGHSLGTIKAVRYLFEGEHKDKISRLILLAPFDKNAFLERNAPGKWQEQLAQAEAKIADGKAEEIVPIPEFEEYPITYRTFVSWYNQTDLSRIWDFYQKDYDFPILKQINIPVKVIIGSEDVFIAYPEFGVSTESAMDTIKKHIKDCETVVIKSSGHTYLGFEDQVADEVVSFSD